MLSLDARFTDARTGLGFGRWRTYYSPAEDLAEALNAAQSLVPKAEIRVRVRKRGPVEIVYGPKRVEEIAP